MSKFNVGQKVYLFNSVSMSIEEDSVYAVLFVPIAKPGVAQDSSKSLQEKLSSGQMEVHEQYQLSLHQGVLDASCLFASEDECKAFFRDFFN